MPATLISTATADHYTWGGLADTQCDAWYLVRTPTLHIIEEQMPPGACEVPHHHIQALQFFYVLAGELTLSVDDQAYILHPHQGLEILPGHVHQAANKGKTQVRFLVTSNPPSHNDRIDRR